MENLSKKEMMKALEEMIQVVLIRIPKEVEAMRFYQSAAEKSVTQASKELFLNLAQQEKGHEAELRRILEDLKRQLNELKRSS
ncbi:rubrerythrin [Deferribacterales bacterium Es71-Z0220]|uniref:ferritin family protein n=1 Tax=Deferrivibrio essentukiensis TaxID=2880922 RepID=UPI001F618459|nr:ferritin family protein [Deferrivibrio essentukiensis]MBZ4671830.1 Rubrerythrin [Deferribacteraceae bacterium]MCB4204759.1 rubrerythrin [Deferrivibrio essentukiensis]